MRDLWNERFSTDEYVYGEEPNLFVKEWLPKFKAGKALFLAEGEGRNSVFAAEQGWEVDAVDYSEAAKVKALKLAAKRNVQINYSISDLEQYEIPEASYDLAVMTFLHPPEELRKRIHAGVIKSLKIGGVVILEAYDKDQLKYGTGGPKVPELLYSLQDIAEDFMTLEFLKFEKAEPDMSEGTLHNGKSSVVRFVGRRVSETNG